MRILRRKSLKNSYDSSGLEKGQRANLYSGRSLGRSLAERGQASLEMILLMIIGMIVILGLVYRFNTAFKRYTIEMYGTYYRCLLETGELPGTGSVCRDREARFNIANGRTLVTDGDTGTGGTDDGSVGGGGSGGSGGSGGGGTGGNGGGSGSGGKGGRGSGGNQAGSGGGSGGGGSSGGGGGGSEAVGSNQRNGGRGSVVGRLQRAGRNRSTSVGSASDLSKEDADMASANGENGLIVDATSARYSRDSLRSAKTKMAFSMEGDQYQREETKAVAPISATATKKAADRSGNSLRPRKAIENGDRAPAKKRNDDDGGGLEFGKLFRLFLIIGIIIAIVVFLGGQVLQISKSGDR